MRLFRDREDAGRQLSELLVGVRDSEPLVLAITRGGMPVAYEVAALLDASLEALWRPLPDVRERVVILVDDGITTGGTARAALATMRKLGAGVVIVAAPIAAEEIVNALEAEAAAVVAVERTASPCKSGPYYSEFHEVGDVEVNACLERASRERAERDRVADRPTAF